MRNYSFVNKNIYKIIIQIDKKQFDNYGYMIYLQKLILNVVKIINNMYEIQIECYFGILDISIQPITLQNSTKF